MQIKPVAFIESGFKEKFGIPRQSGLEENTLAKIVFAPEFRNPEALRGLEGFDYLWLIWEFSANRRRGAEVQETVWQPTVRPPRLGGNRHMGVFATRSPFRPNPLGLSSVRIERIDSDPDTGPVIWVRGADLMDGTPIYDIKPYITYADSHPEASCGYVDGIEERKLHVTYTGEAMKGMPDEPGFKDELSGFLCLDPRPSYQDDPERIYGLSYGGRNIKFQVKDETITVIEII